MTMTRKMKSYLNWLQELETMPPKTDGESMSFLMPMCPPGMEVINRTALQTKKGVCCLIFIRSRSDQKRFAVILMRPCSRWVITMPSTRTVREASLRADGNVNRCRTWWNWIIQEPPTRGCAVVMSGGGPGAG